MAASSVTGTGQGSAERKNKGSEHQTLGVEHLIGTRVVASGVRSLTSASPSNSVVTFEQVLDSSFSYAVVVTPVVTSSAAAPTGTYAAYGLTVNGFTILGPNTVTTPVHWAVMRI